MRGRIWVDCSQTLSAPVRSCIGIAMYRHVDSSQPLSAPVCEWKSMENRAISLRPYLGRFVKKSPTSLQKSPTFRWGRIWVDCSRTLLAPVCLRVSEDQGGGWRTGCEAVFEKIRDKEPYIPSQEPYISAKEPYIPAKVPPYSNERQGDLVEAVLANGKCTCTVCK